MSLDTVLTDAFLLGVGKSRRSALKSSRYQTLVNEFPHIPYLQAEQSAEMALLGEQIADRAFLNLPYDLRSYTLGWSELGQEGQEALLKLLKLTLGDMSLEYRAGQPATKLGVEERSLPHQYKSWVRNPALPSCLGLAQMLVGFGRATGAPCMLIEIVQPHHTNVTEQQYLHLTQLSKLLEAHAPTSHALARAKAAIDLTAADCLQVLEQHAANNQAHLALAIRCNENWWVVDPYFDTVLPIGLSVKQLDKTYASQNAKPRQATSHWRGASNLQMSIGWRLKVLEEYLPYLDRLDEPRSAWTFDTASVQSILGTNALYGTLVPASETERDDALFSALATSVCSLRSIKRYHAIPDNDHDIDELMKLNYEKAMHNKRFRNQSFVRTMTYLVRECYLAIMEMSDETMQAKVQEYGHATFQLAVRTVYQLAHLRSIDVAELSLYSNSQWVFHNTFGAVQASGNKRLKQVTATKLKHIRESPLYVLPAIRHLL